MSKLCGIGQIANNDMIFNPVSIQKRFSNQATKSNKAEHAVQSYAAGKG